MVQGVGSPHAGAIGLREMTYTVKDEALDLQRETYDVKHQEIIELHNKAMQIKDKKKHRLIGSIIGAVIGAVVGFLIGGPAGAVVGAMAGYGLGGQLGEWSSYWDGKGDDQFFGIF